MRTLIVILFFMPFFAYSQDTVSIPRAELDSLFVAMDDIIYQDSIKTILIQDYETQIQNYKNLQQKDSLIVFYKNQEIELLNTQIGLYEKRLNQVDAWYKKPWVGFVVGMASTIVTIHAINYSLP